MKLTQVDFYITQLPDFSATLPLLSKIVLKAYASTQALFLYCETEVQAKKLDDFLWTFNDISFVPHSFINTESAADAPVLIGYGDVLPNEKNILLNLTDASSERYQDFERIIEIVCDENKVTAREHYKFYKSLEVPVKSHDI